MKTALCSLWPRKVSIISAKKTKTKKAVSGKAVVFSSGSAAQTVRFGEKMGRLLAPGDVVVLEGELGSGKTTLVKGIAGALGVDRRSVTSPSFVFIHEYRGRRKIYHMDWYRLKSVRGIDRMLADECLRPDALTLVEWPGRGSALLPEDRIRAELFHKGPNQRQIRVSVKGKKREDFLKALAGP